MGNYWLSYPAVCYSGEDSIKMVFPDLPGLTPTVNDTNLAIAVVQAQILLTRHIMDLLDGNDLLPGPTPLHYIRTEEPEAEGVISTLVLIDVVLPHHIKEDKKDNEPVLC